MNLPQREIKFRCFNTNAKTMYPNEHFALTMDGNELQLMPECSHYDKPYLPNPGHMIYMQYTGLKDKNGVEIYEGDIVHIGGTNCVVKFNKGRFIADGDPVFDPLDDCCEVLGNIYENGDLLK